MCRKMNSGFSSLPPSLPRSLPLYIYSRSFCSFPAAEQDESVGGGNAKEESVGLYRRSSVHTCLKPSQQKPNITRLQLNPAAAAAAASKMIGVLVLRHLCL